MTQDGTSSGEARPTSIAVRGLAGDDVPVEVPLPAGPGLVVIAGRHPATLRPVAASRLDAQLTAFDPEQVRAACTTLREAARAQLDAEQHADTLAADRVAVLETGLLFRDKHGTQPCPVCMAGVLDDGWVERARVAMATEQEAVQALRTARSASFRARQVLAALVKDVPAPPAEEAGVATVTAARVAHQVLSAIPADGDVAFADHVDAHLPPLVAAYEAVRSEAAEARDRVRADVGQLGGLSRDELRALTQPMVVPADVDDGPVRLVLDDPTQMMDPAQIEGFVEVLERLARDRQVVVVSGDDRLLAVVRSGGGTARVVDVG